MPVPGPAWDFCVLVNRRIIAACLSIVVAFLAGDPARAQHESPLGLTEADSTSVKIRVKNEEVWIPPLETHDGRTDVEAASFYQPQPILTPEIQGQAAIPLPSVVLSSSLFSPRGRSEAARDINARLAEIRSPQIGLIFGEEAAPRAASDAGSLLRKSPSAVGIGTQRRTPIVTDPRIRGSRVGQLAASGSHWVPARIDLDTAVSKFDSRIVDSVLSVKGPYSALYGPGLHFLDIALLESPRYSDEFISFGSSSIEYQTNGEQVHGRQMLWGADDTWGYRFGYSHRTGNNYRTGAGTEVPASYNSREFDLALGRNLSDVSRVEFQLLRLDQTGVEFPGQAFDIDFLKTDGYEVKYLLEDQPFYDQLAVEVWYNRTVFAGNAQNIGKRQQFPFYDLISFEGNTDVDSMSLGYRFALSWGEIESTHLTAGVDLRYLKQELNEISSGRLGLTIWTDANSPIPRSDSLDQGFFAEMSHRVDDRTVLATGVRADVVTTAVIDDPAKLDMLGIQQPQSSLADILGTDEFDQSFVPWLAYLTAQYQLDTCWTAEGKLGYSQRPPSLTELYAAEPFMFLLQNGLNTVTGDPRLEAEQLYQADFGLRYNNDRWRCGLLGFHAWVNDYITFENTRIVPGPPLGQVEQVNIRYVNTDLATFVGGEAYLEYDYNDWLTPFATLTYVEGTDRSRNGNFATRQATPGAPSIRDSSLPRGGFSGVAGNDTEPLPGISPLEARLGVRLHQAEEIPQWAIEFTTRLVDDQNRVAASLLESTTPGFVVFDLRGYWNPRDNLTLIAGVENIGDRAYREHLDFRSQNGIQILQPGINFYTSVDLSY